MAFKVLGAIMPRPDIEKFETCLYCSLWQYKVKGKDIKIKNSDSKIPAAIFLWLTILKIFFFKFHERIILGFDIPTFYAI